MKRSTQVAALAIVAVLVAVAAATTSADEESTTAARPDRHAATVSTIQPEAAQAISVLATERAAGDALADDLAEPLRRKPAFGSNPDLSRLAIGQTTNSLYVIPGDDHACGLFTVGEGWTITCPSTADIAAGLAGPASTALETGHVAIYGLVPDGVATVTLGTGPDAEQIDVQNNAYLAVRPATEMPETVGYTGPSGGQSFPVADPTALQGPQGD